MEALAIGNFESMWTSTLADVRIIWGVHENTSAQTGPQAKSIMIPIGLGPHLGKFHNETLVRDSRY